MYKILLFIFLSIFFSSCSSNLALKHFNKDELETKAILYTKKSDLYDYKGQKLILWLTYLTPLEIKDFSNKKEYFLVSTYFTRDENQDFLSKNYKLTLNGKEPLSITEIKDKKILSKKVAWGNEYLVEFKKYRSEKELNFKLEDESKNFIALTYQK